jgi:hypothetical protein
MGRVGPLTVRLGPGGTAWERINFFSGPSGRAPKMGRKNGREGREFRELSRSRRSLYPIRKDAVDCGRRRMLAQPIGVGRLGPLKAA